MRNTVSHIASKRRKEEAPRVTDVDLAAPAAASELFLTVPIIPSEMREQTAHLSPIDLALLEGYVRRQMTACDEVARHLKEMREGIFTSRKTIPSVTASINLRAA